MAQPGLGHNDPLVLYSTERNLRAVQRRLLELAVETDQDDKLDVDDTAAIARRAARSLHDARSAIRECAAIVGIELPR